MNKTGILVGVDGSSAGRVALRWALERASARRVPVTLMLVVDNQWGEVNAEDLRQVTAMGQAALDRELQFARDSAPDVAVTASLRVGQPMFTLAKTAEDFELVVVGTHECGSAPTSSPRADGLRLALISPVPAALIPRFADQARHDVVVGIGSEQAWAAPIRHGLTEAKRLGMRLVLLQSAPSAASDRVSNDHIIATARSLARDIGYESGIELRRSASAPGDALTAASWRSTLTIVGRPTSPAGADLRDQTVDLTTGDVVMNLGGPVMVVPYPTTSRRMAHAPGAETHSAQR